MAESDYARLVKGLWVDTVFNADPDIDPKGELCWESMAIGFFVGYKFTPKQAQRMYRELLEEELA